MLRKDIEVIRDRMYVLHDQKYIGRNYDGSYRLQNKPASYFLLPDGIQALKKQTELNHNVLHSLYKDKNAREEFVRHWLNVFALYKKFKELYPKLNFFSKSELADYDYYPKELPDAYLSSPKDFFLDSYEQGGEFSFIKRKIRSFVEHYESDGWEVTESAYPKILLVCETARLEARVQGHTSRMLNNYGININFYTTSHKALLGANIQSKIWSLVTEPDELLSFSEL